MSLTVSYMALSTVLSDIYTRAATIMLGGDLAGKLDKFQQSLSRIEQAISNQDRALVRAAFNAVRDGDTETALNLLRQGLEADPLQPGGWRMYATIMAAKGNQPRAAELLKQMVDWFGLDCPALPDEIKAVALSRQGRVIAANAAVQKEIVADDTFGEQSGATIALSTRGMAVGFQHQVGFKLLFIDNRAIRYKVHFVPWEGEQPAETLILQGEEDLLNVTAVTGMTERFLVIDNKKVIDLNGVYPVATLSATGISAVFGNLAPTRYRTGEEQGVDIAYDKKPVTKPEYRLQSANSGHCSWEDVTRDYLRVTATIRGR